MRLILVDRDLPQRRNFYPLALSRPIWELRCGMRSIGERLAASVEPAEVACFVPPYLAEVYRRQTPWAVNDSRSLSGESLLLADGRLKAIPLAAAGPSQVVRGPDGELLCARIDRTDLPRLNARSIDTLIESALRELPTAGDCPDFRASKNGTAPVCAPPTWNYTWELVLANAAQLTDDFRAAGRSGIEGTLEEPSAIRGSRGDVYIAPGAKVHPMVVLDAEHGPIYIDRQAEIHPFTRVEGPCYIGPRSILLGAKCREGTSIGPMCRVGGEIEESILQGFSNKYHDGFLGHAYVGQWVNLGALTTNSDLKNDYSGVSVVLDGRTPIDTGSTKVGALIGDHAKTSIGTLLNTGAYLGPMSVAVTSGRLLPKFMPAFAWCVNDAVTEGQGKARAYQTARTVLSRRQCAWSEADEALWDEVYRRTAPEREEAIARSVRRRHGT